MGWMIFLNNILTLLLPNQIKWLVHEAATYIVTLTHLAQSLPTQHNIPAFSLPKKREHLKFFFHLLKNKKDVSNFHIKRKYIRLIDNN